MRIAAFFAIVLLLTAAVPRGFSPVAAAECDPNYSGFCVPVAADVNCEDIKAAVTVTGTDVYDLDRDNDGMGCDEYAGASGGGSGNGGNGITGGNGSSGASGGSGSCTQVFVAGKGVIDSCSGERAATSRVYPRKPGVPPNGCVNTCPEAPVASEGQPGAATGPRADATPADVETEYTGPLGTNDGTPAPAQNCDRVSYPDVCIPVAPPYLSCTDVPDRNFRVRAPDPHRFDADGNGIGCEEVQGPTIGR